MRRGLVVKSLSWALNLCLLALTACAVDPPSSDIPAGVGGFVPRETNATSTPVERHGQLHVCGTRLCGEKGEPVQLRGPSSMWLHWENDGYAESKAGLQWMRDNWNVTVLRAAMGIEPSGAYLTDPATAKSQVETIIKNAEELGIYVIIDWHDHNAHMHQAQAVQFFREMSAAHGSSKNVLWETFNEPESLNWSTTLKPYHEAAVAAIREGDPDNVIILGTPTWSQRVDTAASDPVAGTNLMYTLHFYSCTHGASFRSTANQALRRGLPLFVTEWGATDADGGSKMPRVCLDEAELWTTWMNDLGISWTAWKLDGCPDSSCYFKPGASAGGGWTDADLQGHGIFVRDHIIQ